MMQDRKDRRDEDVGEDASSDMSSHVNRRVSSRMSNKRPIIFHQVSTQV